MAESQDPSVLVKVKADVENAVGGLKKFDKTLDESTKHASTLGDELKGAAESLIGFLGFVAVINTIKNMMGEAVAQADALDKLSKQTRISTDALQAYGEAARQANVDQGTLSAALLKYTVVLGQARAGNTGAIQMFKDLGLSMDQLKKMSPDERLSATVTAIEKIKDPADKAALGVQGFGKQFLDLEPALRAVTGAGMDKFLDDMRKLGVYLSPETIDNMHKLSDNMNDLKTESQGFTNQFMAGVVPQLNGALKSVLTATQGASSGITNVGAIVGWVLKAIVNLFVAIGQTIGIVVAATVEDFKLKWEGAVASVKAMFDGLGKAIALSLKGHFSAAADAFKEGMVKAAKAGLDAAAKEAQNRATAWQAIKDSFLNAFAPPDTGTKKPDAGDGDGTGGGPSSQELLRLFAARQQLLQAQLANELALYQAHAKLLDTQQQHDYQQGLISLKDYFEKRAASINGDYDLQVEQLRKQRALLAQQPTTDAADEISKKAQLAALDGQIDQAEMGRQQALLELTLKRKDAERDLYAKKIEAAAAILALNHDQLDSEKALLQVQLQQLDLQLRQAGVPEGQRQQILSAKQQQGEAVANLNEQKRLADEAMRSMQIAIDDVNRKVANGQEFAINGESEIAQIEKDRLPTLEAIAAAMLKYAQATGDPQAIADAEAFSNKLKDVATSADLAGQHLAQFKQDAQDAFESGLENFLASGINNVHSLGDAFRSLGLSIAQAMQAAAAKQLALLATQKLFALLKHGQDDSDKSTGQDSTKMIAAGAAVAIGGSIVKEGAQQLQEAALALGKAAGALLVANMAGSATGLATGGPVFGPGTSTSDSIWARLSDGEYVHNAAAVRYYGMEFMHALNTMQLPKFPGYAEGGPVQLTAPMIAPMLVRPRTPDVQPREPSGNTQGPSLGVRIVNQVDPTMVTDAMDSSAGERVIINTISRNQTKIRQMVR